MRKLLALMGSMTLVTTSITSVVACKADNGKPVPTFIYNGTAKYVTNPTANSNVTNGIFNADKAGKDSDTNEYQFSINKGAYGLGASVLLPLLYGINLTKDNSTSQKGAKWKPEQIEAGLTAQKEQIINTASGQTEKEAWTDFYNNYSGTDDSFFTQTALIAQDNDSLKDTEGNIINSTPNLEKATDKDFVKQDSTDPNMPFVYTPSSLKVLTPVQEVIDWLNNPNNGYHLGQKQTSQSRIYQSARFALINIPEIIVTFEFTNKNSLHTFKVKIPNVTASVNYLSYQDPNTSGDDKKYGHQWFFTGYQYRNFDNYNSDEYLNYNFKIQDIQSTKLAMGYVVANEYNNVPLNEEDDGKIKEEGKLVANKSDFTLPDLSWEILVDSIDKDLAQI